MISALKSDKEALECNLHETQGVNATLETRKEQLEGENQELILKKEHLQGKQLSRCLEIQSWSPDWLEIWNKISDW